MITFWLTVLILGLTGLLAAIILYVVAKKFYVYENPRIGEVEALLPGANCGGCGFKGCHDFAAACASAKSLEGLYCPTAGKAGMDAVGIVLGLAATERTRKVATVACHGTCALRPVVNSYRGPVSCAIEAATYAGTTDCSWGCLGCGDCERICPQNAITMNETTGLPEVNYRACTGCGACVKACPRHLFSLSDVMNADRRVVHVACSNHDKGPMAMKGCQVSCIACGKCKKACEYDAIVIDNLCAKIDTSVCTRCGACVPVCPRKSILIDQIKGYHE